MQVSEVDITEETVAELGGSLAVQPAPSAARTKNRRSAASTLAFFCLAHSSLPHIPPPVRLQNLSDVLLAPQ